MRELAPVPDSVLEAVFRSRGYEIRTMVPAQAEELIFSEITKINLAHGANEESMNNEFAIKEAIGDILRHYRHLSIEELPIAYQLWRNGIIKTEGSAEMYGGKFTATNFARIMAAYNKHRQRALAALLEIQHRETIEADRVARHKAAHAELVENFDAYIKRYAESGKGWRDIPVHWYEIALAKKLFDIDIPEMKKIKEEAAECVCQDIDGITEKSIWAKAIPTAGGLESRVKNAARRIYLFRKVILPLR